MPRKPTVVPPGAPKRRGRKPASMPVAEPAMAGDVGLGGLSLTPELVESGVEIPMDDGSVVIEINTGPVKPDVDTSDHQANLAEALDDAVLGRVAEELLDGIEADDNSRSDWMAMRAKGIDLLGVKLEDPRSGNASAPVEGQSVVRDPVLLEASLRFQANAQGEMLPAAGPVKTISYGGTAEADALADALERDLNYYLTSVASEYYPDTRRMFFWTGFSGMAFKKVYRCPLRRRPVSESVDASDLIVSDTITDLRNASRITHQITMRQSVMKRMMIAGAYRDIDLTPPTPQSNAVKDKVAQIQGVAPYSERPQDQPYTVYECYCELDLEGFEHKDKSGEETGLPLPYIVTIDRDSRKVLQIRRNWKEGDDDYIAKIPFVAYGYAPSFGFYNLGLLHILGNLSNALTALTREAIDAGMFANFPGFLYAKSSARQMSNEFRIAPGSGMPIDTGGMPIGQAVMALPYKPIDPAHVALIAQVRDVAQRLGGTADTPVGEGKQDAPVGTTLAMIEQATKIEGAVHKALHAAQAEEFRLLCDLFREDPEALWRGNRRPALGQGEERLAKFKAALEHADVVPAADPNVPSHMHRVMKATAIKQLASANPQMYNQVAVDSRILAMLNVDRPDELFMPPQPAAPPMPDPTKAMEIQAKAEIADKDRQAKVVLAAMDAEQRQKDREARQNVEVLKVAASVIANPEGDKAGDEQLEQMSGLMSPLRPPPSARAPISSAPPPLMPRPAPMRPQPPPGLGALLGMRGPPNRGMPLQGVGMR